MLRLYYERIVGMCDFISRIFQRSFNPDGSQMIAPVQASEVSL